MNVNCKAIFKAYFFILPTEEHIPAVLRRTLQLMNFYHHFIRQ